MIVSYILRLNLNAYYRKSMVINGKEIYKSFEHTDPTNKWDGF